MPVPLLLVSDSISCSSGLGRITRDLASRVHEHLSDIYRVGTAGYGGAGSRKSDWPDYHFHSVKDWLLPELPAIWEDFAGDEEGIILFIWDVSRLYWVGMPQTCTIPFLRRWVETAKVKKWVYGAIDASGPMGKISTRLRETYQGFDRILDYSPFSCSVTGHVTHLPHGIDTKVFYPRDPKQARKQFVDGGWSTLKQDSLLVGIVATNQTRKNWQLGMETCKILLDRGHDVQVWAHTDMVNRYWDIGTMIADYGMAGRVAITTQRLTDDQIAWMYSACDVTLGIGPEGFGYPMFESLACGVPCIVGSYGAQADYVPKNMQIDPIAYFYEGGFCSKRPVHDPVLWARKAAALAPRGAWLPEFLDWEKPELWEAWSRWFREGING